MLLPSKPETIVELSQSVAVASSSITCFVETPRKTGVDEPLSRIGAFDLFNLFTADIIRSKDIFTR